MESVYVKLQSGERFENPKEAQVASILESLHPEYNAQAIFYNGVDEWLSTFGCVTEGFAVSYQASSAVPVLYCSQMLSISEAQSLIGRFLGREPGWRCGVSWKRESRAVRIGIATLVIAIIILILISFLRDVLGPL